jgi:hypothetical protein
MVDSILGPSTTSSCSSDNDDVPSSKRFGGQGPCFVKLMALLFERKHSVCNPQRLLSDVWRVNRKRGSIEKSSLYQSRKPVTCRPHNP